jgi:hypothetical protein
LIPSIHLVWLEISGNQLSKHMPTFYVSESHITDRIVLPVNTSRILLTVNTFLLTCLSESNSVKLTVSYYTSVVVLETLSSPKTVFLG